MTSTPSVPSQGDGLPVPAEAVLDVIRQHEIHSVFQPIVDLDSGRVVGYETLARGPEGPLSSPAALFTAARQAGVLAQLDQACLAAALEGAAQQGLVSPLTVFVNIEPEVLDLAPVAELLAIAAAAPGGLRIVLEITERALAARPAELLQTVQRVRELGWGVALDDVGADAASLAFMPFVRPDVVKLDLALVQERPGPAVAEIMNAVNAYAERTGALILAEGIETAAHLASARALGASLGQGWLFGRPLAKPEPVGTAVPLVLPAAEPAIASIGTDSPFCVLPAGTPLRRAPKRLLVEVSKQLEREAMRLGETCVVAATFQHGRNFTAATAQRYRELVARTGFVCALGEELADEPVPGLRGARLRPDDPAVGEWDVVVVGPHFSAALLARDLGDSGPDMARTFEYVLTYERDTVVQAARSLLLRVAPQLPRAAHLTGSVSDKPGTVRHDDRGSDVPAPIGADRSRGYVARLEELAYTDHLTGLMNRRRIQERIEVELWEARAGGHALALLLLDLDGFKQVNSRWGHRAGDELLRVISQRLANAVRRSDLVARLGADAFLVAVTGLDDVNAANRAADIAGVLADAVRLPALVADQELSLSASIGISTYPHDGQEFGALLHRADLRMYQDKHRQAT